MYPAWRPGIKSRLPDQLGARVRCLLIHPTERHLYSLDATSRALRFFQRTSRRGGCGCGRDPRLLARQLTRHHVPVELLESLRVIRMPDDVVGRVAAVFEVGQHTGLAKVGKDELEVALVDLRKTRRCNVERPTQRMQRIRTAVLAVCLRARRIEGRASRKTWGEHARDREARKAL